MCCYEQIINAIIQKIIQEMHVTTDDPSIRQYTRESILEAAVNESEKMVTLDLTSEVARTALANASDPVVGRPFLLAFASAYPNHTLVLNVRAPLNLAALATEPQAT